MGSGAEIGKLGNGLVGNLPQKEKFLELKLVVPFTLAGIRAIPYMKNVGFSLSGFLSYKGQYIMSQKTICKSMHI